MSILPTLFQLCHLKGTGPMKSAALKCNVLLSTDIQLCICYHPNVQIKRESANTWQYKVGNNVTIANVLCVCEKPN